MTKLVKRILSSSAQNNVAWRILDKTVLKITRYLESERAVVDRARAEDERRRTQALEVSRMFPDLTVRHGPFRGLRYPSAEASGSALAPKLLGCYERELHEVVEEICAKSYTQVVDIGCGEGYYAVGLALRLRGAVVHAFDTDPRARKSCAAMAELNGVGARVTVGEFCDRSALLKIAMTGRGLVISDCEGYERELFTSESLAHLGAFDLLIETHDFIDLSISETLERLLQATHDIRVIKSLDDIEKAKYYKYDEIDRLDIRERRRIVEERRPAIMEWLYATSRQSG